MKNLQGGIIGMRGPLAPAIFLLIVGIAVAFTNNAPVWVYVAIIVVVIIISLLLLKTSDASKNKPQ